MAPRSLDRSGASDGRLDPRDRPPSSNDRSAPPAVARHVRRHAARPADRLGAEAVTGPSSPRLGAFDADRLDAGSGSGFGSPRSTARGKRMSSKAFPARPRSSAAPSSPAGVSGLRWRPPRDPTRPARPVRPDSRRPAAWFAERGEPAYRPRQVTDAVWRQRRRRPPPAHPDASDLASHGARRGLPVRHRRRHGIPPDDGGCRDDGKGPPSPPRRRPHRIGADALPGATRQHASGTRCASRARRARRRLPVVRHRRLGRPGPDGGRDRGPGALAARRLAADDRRLTNIVFMGMGEPLLNLDRVLAAIEALNDPARFGLGARHITVSTSGVVPGIRRLTALGPQFTLAVSLHAARDPLRDVLVPLNRRWPVADVVAAARDHSRKTGRRISYEVTMIGGVNDTPADAEALATLSARRPRPRQPHPDEPGRAHALDREPDARHRGGSPRPCAPPGSGRRSDATEARRSSGLRPARGRTGR